MGLTGQWYHDFAPPVREELQLARIALREDDPATFRRLLERDPMLQARVNEPVCSTPGRACPRRWKAPKP